jgi:hypothetical protein
MAPWTGFMLQATLDKMTVTTIDQTAQKLVGLLETRSHVQKLAVILSNRVQRSYKSTFHVEFDHQRRSMADSLVASVFQSFANSHKKIKGVPTPEGLSGTRLLKSELLSAGASARSSGRSGTVAPIVSALYNCRALTCDEVKTFILAFLEEKASDATRVEDAILLLEYSAREIEGSADRETMDDIMAKVNSHLDALPEEACERKSCGERIIPSLSDRYRVSEASAL